MITKAEILQLPKGAYTNDEGKLVVDNKFKIYIPIFRRAGEPKNNPSGASIMYATVCYTPGSQNGYRVGDIVYVAFENNQMGEPVIIGKLFLNKVQETKNSSYLVGDELNISTSATLPIDTTIGDISGEDLERLFRQFATLNNKKYYEHNIVVASNEDITIAEDYACFTLITQDSEPYTSSSNIADLLYAKGLNSVTSFRQASGRCSADSLSYVDDVDVDFSERDVEISRAYCESVVVGIYGDSSSDLNLVISILDEDTQTPLNTEFISVDYIQDIVVPM